ncbi:MAG: hypothetical protein ABFD25_06720 [Clostridiaceae bacterium]
MDNDIDIIKKHNNVELLLIEGAKHSLELDDDLKGCLKILSQVIDLYVKFLNCDTSSDTAPRLHRWALICKEEKQ